MNPKINWGINLKRLLIVISCFLVILVCTTPVLAEDYILCVGDVLEISVYGYEELQLKQVSIRPDGKLAFPLVGEMQAAGKKPVELSTQLTEALVRYVKNPQVIVNIIKYHTIRVYVLGEVNRPGMYELEKQHNLLDALGVAGGYTKYALRKGVYVVRTTGKYQTVNLDRLLKKGDLTQNLSLTEGDLVYLNKNGISFLNDILPYLGAAYQIKTLIE